MKRLDNTLVGMENRIEKVTTVLMLNKSRHFISLMSEMKSENSREKEVKDVIVENVINRLTSNYFSQVLCHFPTKA